MVTLYRAIVFISCSTYGKSMNEKIKTSASFAIYPVIGAVSGLLLNFLIMKSPLPAIFPGYAEGFAGKIYSVDIISGIFIYCIAAPVLEEIIFRLLAYDLLYRYLGYLPSALISSLIFAVYHMNVVQGVYAFIMGMLFCSLYHRDHRIPVPILLHIGANLAVWLLSNTILK